MAEYGYNRCYCSFFAEAYYPISTKMKEKAFGWFGGGNDNGVKGFMDVFH
jgi:hypothetical protein